MLNTAPPTTADAIVAGENSGKVNTFLQLIALASWRRKVAMQSESLISGKSFPKSLEITWSQDGENFEAKQFFFEDKSESICLLDVQAKFLRIKPILWSFRCNSQQEIVEGCGCLDFMLSCRDPVDENNRINIVPSSNGLVLLQAMVTSASSISCTLEILISNHERIKRIKEESVKKVLKFQVQFIFT